MRSFFSNLVALSSLLTSSFLIQPAAGIVDVNIDDAVAGVPHWGFEARDVEEPDNNFETLHALPSWGYDATFEKRSELDLTQLNPASTETFLWGGSPRNNRFPFFNMTMYADDGELIISMERFLPMLDHVECGESMVLAFKNKAAFDHAIREWQWVNEDETHSFIMMANHPACGVEERSPYYILDADYDEEKNIAYLYGEEKSMEDIAHTFDADFGTATLPDSQGPQLKPRFEWSKGFDVDTSSEYSGELISYEGETWPSFSISCERCGTTGGFGAEGRLVWSGFAPDEVIISFQAAGVGAYADLAINLHGTLPVSVYYVSNFVKDPPVYGLNTPIGKIGLTAAPQYGVSFGTFTGNVTFHIGAGMNLPDTATAELSISGDPDYTAGSWVPEGYDKPVTAEGSIDGFTGTAFLQVFMGAKFSLLNWQMGAGITMKPLNFDVVLETGCDGGESGVSITEKLGSVIGAFVGEFTNEFGVSVPGPGSAKKRLGLAMTWTFWKGVWWEATQCLGGSSEKRSHIEERRLQVGGVPHVRRGTGFFNH